MATFMTTDHLITRGMMREAFWVSSAAMEGRGCQHLKEISAETKLTHVHGRLITHKHSRAVCHGYDSSKTVAAPIASIREHCEGVSRIVSRCHNQQSDKDAEPSSDMEDEEGNLDCRQARSQRSVEEETKAHNSPTQQSVVKRLWCIFWVVENCQSRDGCSCGEGDQGKVAQPSEGDEPASDVAQE